MVTSLTVFTWLNLNYPYAWAGHKFQTHKQDTPARFVVTNEIT